MILFLHPKDEGPGLDPKSFAYRTIREPMPLNEIMVEMKALYGDGFIHLDDVERIFGPMMRSEARSTLMTDSRAAVFKSRKPEFDPKQHVLIPDIGISIRDMFVAMGADAFQSRFLKTCERIGIADESAPPQWRVIQRKDTEKQFTYPSSYSLRSILYASVVFFLTRSKALNRDLYHYRVNEAYDEVHAMHLRQKDGRMYLIPALEKEASLGDIVAGYFENIG